MQKFILAAVLVTSTPALADAIGIADCSNKDDSIRVTVESWDTGMKTASILENDRPAKNDEDNYSYYDIKKKRDAELPTYYGKKFELILQSNERGEAVPAQLKATTASGRVLNLMIDCEVY